MFSHILSQSLSGTGCCRFGRQLVFFLHSVCETQQLKYDRFVEVSPFVKRLRRAISRFRYIACHPFRIEDKGRIFF